MVRIFLDSAGIRYRTAPSIVKLDGAAIAAQAKTAVVLVECWK